MPKRDDHSELWTITTYQRFIRVYRAPLKQDLFVSLCTYLQILLRNGHLIPASAMDSFVHSHSEFYATAAKWPTGKQDTDPEVQPTAYYDWFVKHKLQDHEHGTILDEELLRLICRENPYSDNSTEEGMTLIADIATKIMRLGPARPIYPASFICKCY